MSFEDRNDSRNDDREHKPPLASEKVVAGKRIYYFDVKETRDGSKYVTITETRQAKNGYRSNRVMLFEEYFDDFKSGFSKIADFLGK